MRVVIHKFDFLIIIFPSRNFQNREIVGVFVKLNYWHTHLDVED